MSIAMIEERLKSYHVSSETEELQALREITQVKLQNIRLHHHCTLGGASLA
jgi:hypothetical protein